MQVQFNLSNYDFILTPQSLVSTQRDSSNYFFELEKGLRKIKRIEENIIFGQSNEYLFTNQETILCKAYKERNTNFQWSLYRSYSGNVEHIDTFRFNISDYFTLYTQELKSYSFQYSRIQQQRNCHQPLGDQWKNLKQHLKNYKFSLNLANSEGNMVLKCSLQIKSQFDYLTQKEQMRMKMLKKNANSDARSTTSRKTSKKKTNATKISEGKENDMFLPLNSEMKKLSHSESQQDFHSSRSCLTKSLTHNSSQGSNFFGKVKSDQLNNIIEENLEKSSLRRMCTMREFKKVQFVNAIPKQQESSSKKIKLQLIKPKQQNVLIQQADKQLAVDKPEVSLNSDKGENYVSPIINNQQYPKNQADEAYPTKSLTLLAILAYMMIVGLSFLAVDQMAPSINVQNYQDNIPKLKRQAKQQRL